MYCLLLFLCVVAGEAAPVAEPLQFESLIPLDVDGTGIKLRGPSKDDFQTVSGVPQSVYVVNPPGYKFDVAAQRFVNDTDASTAGLTWLYVVEGLTSPVRAFVMNDTLRVTRFVEGLLIFDLPHYGSVVVSEVGGFRDSSPNPGVIPWPNEPFGGAVVLNLRAEGGPVAAYLFPPRPSGPGLPDRDQSVSASASELLVTAEDDVRCSGLARRNKTLAWAAATDANAPKLDGAKLVLARVVDDLRLVKSGDVMRYASLGDDLSVSSTAEEMKAAVAKTPDLKGVRCVFVFYDADVDTGIGRRSSGASDVPSAFGMGDVLAPDAGGEMGEGAVRLGYVFGTPPASREFHEATMAPDGSWSWVKVPIGAGDVGVVDLLGRKVLLSSSARSEYKEGEVSLPVPGSGLEFGVASSPFLTLQMKVSEADIGKNYVLRMGDKSASYKLEGLPVGFSATVLFSFWLSAPATEVEATPLVVGGTDYTSEEGAFMRNFRSAAVPLTVGGHVAWLAYGFGKGWGVGDAVGFFLVSAGGAKWSLFPSAGVEVDGFASAWKDGKDVGACDAMISVRADGTYAVPGIGTEDLRAGSRYIARGAPADMSVFDAGTTSSTTNSDAPSATSGTNSSVTFSVAAPPSSSLWVVVAIALALVVVAAVAAGAAVLVMRRRAATPTATYDV